MAEGVTNFLGNTIGEGAAFAAGLAVGPVLAPLLRALENETWSAYPDAPLQAQILAQGAAEGKIAVSEGAADAAFTGISPSRFGTLVNLLKTAPAVAEGLRLLRRQQIDPAGFATLLQRNGLEAAWIAAYQAASVNGLTFDQVALTPAEIALGIVRNVVQDPGILVVTLDTEGSTVPKYPTLNINAYQEALVGGVEAGRLTALVGMVGLPMSPQQAASATFRGIINRQAFNLSILEGDVRPEYADAIFEQAREILTSHDYAELQLRGYYDRATRLANTAKHGMSDADSDLLFDVMGRGLSYHDVVKAKARGGVFNETPADIDPDILWALQRSNLRPEVYGLAWANRYSLPSAFVIKSLLTGGTISEAEGEQLYLDIGWPPDLAKLVATAEAKGTTARPKTATAAQLAEQYKAGTLAPGDYTTALQALGYTPEAATSVKASVDAAPLVAARTANLTKLRTYVAKGQLTDAQAATFLEAENVDPAIGTMLVAAWKREAAIEAAATTPPAA